MIRSRYGRWVAVAGVGLLALLVAFVVFVPRVALGKAAERLERLGLTWSVGGSSAGLSGLSFTDVTIHRQGISKPLSRIAAVDVELSWLHALYDPRGALTRLRMTELELDLDLETLIDLRKNRSAGNGVEAAQPASRAALPEVLIERGLVKLRDPDGTLLSAELAGFGIERGAWKGELATVRVGGQAPEHAEFEGLRATGPMVGSRPQFARGSIDEASITLSTAKGDSDRGSLMRRIKAARSALRTKRSDVEPSSTRSVGLWTDDARVELKKARVVDGSTKPKQPILENLSLALNAEGEGALRVKGAGVTATTGGSLGWDLHVTPRDLKVEGNVSLAEVPFALFAPVLPKLPFYELERTRVGANLAITGKGLESASVRGELSISDLSFSSERLARAPVGPITFTARGQATWTPARRELSNLRGELLMGAARVLITGGLAWPEDGYRVDLKAEMPKTKCESARDIVPDGLLDELAAIELKGEIGAKVTVHVDSADLDATKLDFDFADKCKFVTLPELMNVGRFERPFIHRVLEPDETVFEMETGPGTPNWTPIEQVSPFMVQAVVAHEDGRFFTHHGFAEVEIGNALARNLKARAFKFGASTITMQLVKNVFLHRDKLLSRKFQEAVIVWWLEQQVDKKWLLELYLNVIEYGTSIYGIRNAALHYFGILPLQLTPAQSAFLATILPSPKAYDEQYAKGTISESTRKKVTAFLQHMRSRDRIDDEALAYGLEELANFRFYDPSRPPPLPPVQRGAAQAPPFQLAPLEGWNTFDSSQKVEDGSFGTVF
ncbi:MAG TPA: transglycosylase domain-containing protein [Polyangiales bacterium]